MFLAVQDEKIILHLHLLNRYYQSELQKRLWQEQRSEQVTKMEIVSLGVDQIE
jgi:hypothetical protein